MKIDTSIVENYFSNNINEIKRHWIFSKVIEDEFIFEEIPYNKTDEIADILKIFLNVIENFKPFNLKYWEQIFGKFSWNQIQNKIYLIVGAPNPYDAMVREDELGENCIILDLYRISQYSNNPLKISKLINNFLTHEIAHVLIHKRLTIQDDNNNLEILKYVFFDEGLAHLLSFDEDISIVDFNTNEMQKRRHSSFQKMTKYLLSPDQIDRSVLVKSCMSNNYWDKFAAISGMFTIKEYYFDKGRLFDLFDIDLNSIPFESIMNIR